MSSVVINDEFMYQFRKKLDENHFYGVDRKTFFLGVGGEEVIVETRSKFMSSFNKARMGTPNNILLRVGNSLLIDNRLSGFLDSEILNSDNVIQLWNFVTFFNHHISNLSYTALTLYALDTLDLSGKTILDLGCGEGVLSLFVLKKGAKKVHSVDGDSKYEVLIKNNLRLNNLEPNSLAFIPALFHEENKIFEAIGNHQSNLALVNVGPHFGESDLVAFSLLNAIPGINQVLAGGYYSNSKFGPTRAVIRLASLGFKKNLKYFDFNNQHLNFLVER